MAHQPHSQPQRRAFTMMEILVVMMIVITMMTAAVGAWSGLLAPSAENAATALVEDLVRQARHQSMSSGRPVAIIIDGNARTISGLEQNTVWYESFDEWTDIGSYLEEGEAPEEMSMGMAGYGWRSLPEDRLISFPSPDQRPTPLLISPDDGFYIELGIKPGYIYEAPGTGYQVMPLVLLTDRDGDDSTDPEHAIAGLELWRLPLYAYRPSSLSPSDRCEYDWQATNNYHWMLVGWVLDRPPYPNTDMDEWSDWRSYAAHETDDGIGTWVRDFVVGDPASMRNRDPDVIFNEEPMLGGHWHRVGFLFDGRNLVLSRDGSELARVALPLADDGAPVDRELVRERFAELVGQDVKIWIGRHSVSGESSGAHCAFDQAMVTRLGASDIIRFPEGMQTPQATDTDGNLLTKDDDGDGRSQALRLDYRVVVNEGSASVQAVNGRLPVEQEIQFINEADDSTLRIAVTDIGAP